LPSDASPEQGGGIHQPPPASSIELLAALLAAPALSLALRVLAPCLGLWACALSVPLTLLTILWLVWALVRARLTRGALVAVLLVSAAAWGGLAAHRWVGLGALVPLAVRNMTLTVLGAALGVAAAQAIRDRNLLVPAGVFAAAVDIAVVFWGPTGRAVEHAPQAVTQLSVHAPLPGTAGPPPTPGAAPLPPDVLNVGFLDVLMTAFMLAVLLRFHMRSGLAFWHICLWLCVIALLAVFAGWPIPGWPFIVFAALIPNYDQFRFSRSEKITMGVGFLVALAAVWLVLWATARMW
jgi:hypothetical protein